MDFRTIQEDKRRHAEVAYRTGSIQGMPPKQYVKLNPTWTKIRTSWTPLGKARSSIVTRNTGKYVPGRVKLTPAVHSVYNCGASPCNAYVTTMYTGRSEVIAEVKGDIAAFIVYSAPSYPSHPTSSRLQQELALTAAVADYKSAVADVGMMLAEAGETIGMLVSPFTALPKLLKKLVRPRTFRRPRKNRRIGSPLEFASDAWLQYRYGITPFLLDVDTIRKTTRDVLEPRHVDYAKSRVIKVFDESGTRYPVSGLRPIPISFYGFRSTAVEHVARATAYYRVDGQSSGSQLGVDLWSLPNVVYELIPFSFIVDWWFDVGTWIRAITPKPGITSLGAYTSITSERTATCSINHACYLSPSKTYPLSPCQSSIVATSVRYARSLTTHPVEYPRLQPGLAKWQHKVDLAALSFKPCMALIKGIIA